MWQNFTKNQFRNILYYITLNKRINKLINVSTEMILIHSSCISPPVTYVHRTLTRSLTLDDTVQFKLPFVKVETQQIYVKYGF